MFLYSQNKRPLQTFELYGGTTFIFGTISFVYSYFAKPNPEMYKPNWYDYIGFALYAIGSLINSLSETQRKWFKQVFFNFYILNFYFYIFAMFLLFLLRFAKLRNTKTTAI